MHFFSKCHLGYINCTIMNYYFVIEHKKNLSNVKWKIDKDEKYTMLKQEAHKHEKIYWFTTYINEGHHLYEK